MDESLLNWNPLGFAPDGWKYKDFNKMPEAQWDELLMILGDGNFQLITSARYEIDGLTYKRGQMFISDIGLENVRVYVKNRKS